MRAGLEPIEFGELADRYQDQRGQWHHVRSRVYRSHGRKSVKTVPEWSFPALDLTRRTPRCRSMISLLIHSPRPVPCSPFVEKNGSKILDKLYREIPAPVSATVIRTPRVPVSSASLIDCESGGGHPSSLWHRWHFRLDYLVPVGFLHQSR